MMMREGTTVGKKIQTHQEAVIFLRSDSIVINGSYGVLFSEFILNMMVFTLQTFLNILVYFPAL
jgi:hypothetical protein